MTLTVANIVPRKLLESVLTVQYTVPSRKTIIDKFTVTNISAGAVNLDCYLSASGDSGTTANQIIVNHSIAAYEAYLCPEMVGQILENGGKISTNTSSAAALVISVSGREMT